MLYKLSLGAEPWGAVKLCWWCEGPAEWAPLTGRVAAILDELSKRGDWDRLPGSALTQRASVRPHLAGVEAAPSYQVLSTLRRLVPSLRDRSLATLRADEHADLLPEMPWPDALRLRARAREHGVAIELD